MRLIGQKHSEYKGKSYSKHWVVIPNKLLEELGWKAGDDLEATSDHGALTIKTVGYRAYFYNSDGKGTGSELLADKDKFMELSNLSENQGSQWDTRVEIVPVESTIIEGMNTTYRNYPKKQTYYGKKKNLNKALEESKII